MMDKIGRYEITKPLTNENAGFSQWGFGTCGGKRYFIKEFLAPTYPVQAKELGARIAALKKAECGEFIRKKREIFKIINRASDGNFLRIREFFRVGGKFCIAADALDGIALAEIPQSRRGYLLLTLAHSLAGIHKAGLAHGDLKLSNLIFTADGTEFPVTKIIDVDGCFQISDPPVKEQDLICDQLYMAPEVFRWMCGEEVRLTEKIDVFSAGIIIYQILADELPGVTADCRYPYTAVLNKNEPDLWRIEDPEIRGVVAQMLSADPVKRPDMEMVFVSLRKAILGLDTQEDPGQTRHSCSGGRPGESTPGYGKAVGKTAAGASEGREDIGGKSSGDGHITGTLKGDLLRKAFGSEGTGGDTAEDFDESAGKENRKKGREGTAYFHPPEEG